MGVRVMPDLSKYWLREGQLLGLRMKVDGQARPLWYRILGREYADYTYAFASTANAAATGWIDIQSASNIYILEPRRQNVIFHMFIGVALTNMILYYQYPQSRDRNALIGNRTVDANAIGGWRGRATPYWSPDLRTELFTIYKLRPVLNIFNDTPNTEVPRIYIHAMMYEVDGPYLAGHPRVGDEARTWELIDNGQARLYTIYGTDPVDAPDDIIARLMRNTPVAAANPLRDLVGV